MNWLNPILILLAAYLAVFLEAWYQGFRDVLKTQIDLLPALMVYASLSADIWQIAGLAVAGGLWFDSLSANPLGVTILPLFLPALLIHLRHDLILRGQVFAQIVLGLGASALTPALSLLLLLSTRQAPVLGWGSLWQWMVMSLAGALATPVVFWAFDGLSSALNYPLINESSFRPDREIRRGRS
jgi:rod shape-determining protein MreD